MFFIETNKENFTKENLFFISKNFGLHDPDVISELKDILPSLSKEIYSNTKEIKSFVLNLKGYKLYFKIGFDLKEYFYIFFARKENFDLSDIVGSGTYAFRKDFI